MEKVTIRNFMVDGNLVASEITGDLVRLHTVHGAKCAVIRIGDWGDFTFEAKDVSIAN